MKKEQICSLQRETPLAPSACPLTENYRLSDKKLHTIDRHLMGRSRKQHPAVLATSRKKAQNHFAHPCRERFYVTKFYSVALHQHQATKFCTYKPYWEFLRTCRTNTNQTRAPGRRGIMEKWMSLGPLETQHSSFTEIPHSSLLSSWTMLLS